MLHFKNVAPLLFFGPSFWFLAHLLLNLGDGPGYNIYSFNILAKFAFDRVKEQLISCIFCFFKLH